MRDFDDLRVVAGDSPDVIKAKVDGRERLIRASKKNAIAQVIDSLGDWGFIGVLALAFVAVTAILAVAAPDQLQEWLNNL